jgi:hypothetical protein
VSGQPSLATSDQHWVRPLADEALAEISARRFDHAAKQASEKRGSPRRTNLSG